MSISGLMNLFNSSISAASGWFIEIFNASRVANVYLVFIFLVMLIRFIVAPIFGRSRGSDRARTSAEVNNE